MQGHKIISAVGSCCSPVLNARGPFLIFQQPELTAAYHLRDRCCRAVARHSDEFLQLARDVQLPVRAFAWALYFLLWETLCKRVALSIVPTRSITIRSSCTLNATHSVNSFNWGRSWPKAIQFSRQSILINFIRTDGHNWCKPLNYMELRWAA